MIVECLAIVGILFLMMMTFLRQKKKRAALSVTPLLIVPAFHLLGYPISIILTPRVSLGFWYIYTIVDVVALILTGIALAFVSIQFQRGRSRVIFVSVCGLFCTVLSLIFIYNSIAPSIIS